MGRYFKARTIHLFISGAYLRREFNGTAAVTTAVSSWRGFKDFQNSLFSYEAEKLQYNEGVQASELTVRNGTFDIANQVLRGISFDVLETQSSLFTTISGEKNF